MKITVILIIFLFFSACSTTRVGVSGNESGVNASLRSNVLKF